MTLLCIKGGANQVLNILAQDLERDYKNELINSEIDPLVKQNIIPIPFADSEFKRLMQKMLNKDGDIYYDDVKNFSSAWLDVEGLMDNQKITSANELRFFDSIYQIADPLDASQNLWGFRNDTNLISVTLPPNLTDINKNCFRDCSNLEYIKIPDSVTQIRSYVFSGCSKLKLDKLPAGLQELSENCFAGCSEITISYIPASAIPYNCFSENIKITISQLPSTITSLYSNCFYNCQNITVSEIPESCTHISGHAFQGCSSITSMDILGEVTTIGDAAFYDCAELSSVTLRTTTPSTLGSIVFNNCPKLEAIYVPDSALEAYQSATNWNSYTIKKISEKL